MGQCVEYPLAFPCPEWGCPGDLTDDTSTLWASIFAIFTCSSRRPVPVGGISAQGLELSWKRFKMSEKHALAWVVASLGTALCVRRESKGKGPWRRTQEELWLLGLVPPLLTLGPPRELMPHLENESDSSCSASRRDPEA